MTFNQGKVLLVGVTVLKQHRCCPGRPANMHQHALQVALREKRTGLEHSASANGPTREGEHENAACSIIQLVHEVWLGQGWKSICNLTT